MKRDKKESVLDQLWRGKRISRPHVEFSWSFDKIPDSLNRSSLLGASNCWTASSEGRDQKPSHKLDVAPYF
jgi:hypothetical protein